MWLAGRVSNTEMLWCGSGCGVYPEATLWTVRACVGLGCGEQAVE